jgi:hypothetical protein
MLKRSLLLLSAAVLAPGISQAALYTQDFNVDDTANWTVNNGPTDQLADFFYDYSAIGVPAAPNGTGTRGLKMTCNNTNGIFGGFSVSPTGQSFTGAYKVAFDMWQNYAGPVGPGGNGTTQLTTYGIGTSGTTTFWPGAATKESVAFAVTLDGGSTSDFRAYSTAAPTSYAGGNAVYQAPAGAINNNAAYYAAAFPSVSAPLAQVGLFPGQTGSTEAGEAAFAWRRVEILVDGGFATWSIDGLPIAKIDLSTVTMGGGNILFGHSDTNAGSSTDVNDTLLNVSLIDNISVVAVPEPASLSRLALAGLALRRRR